MADDEQIEQDKQAEQVESVDQSSVDFAGVKPGLSGTVKDARKTVSMKCRNDRCSSKDAFEVNIQGNHSNAGAPHSRGYQCARCRTTWTVGVGGFVNI